MNENRNPSFWPRAVALVTGCAVLGGLIGALAGLVIGNLSRGVYLGITAGAVLSVALVIWLASGVSPRRRGGNQRQPPRAYRLAA